VRTVRDWHFPVGTKFVPRNTARAEALAAGETYYFDGKVCPKGHVCKRKVINFGCAECETIRHRKHQTKYNRAAVVANPGLVATKHARRRAAEREANCTCCTAKTFAEFYNVAKLVGYQIDHITPLADGGAHCIMNLQMLPPDVHARKTAAENSQRARRLN
jgi:5-methylcytosine-specific restriction endonuclease McrA